MRAPACPLTAGPGAADGGSAALLATVRCRGTGAAPRPEPPAPALRSRTSDSRARPPAAPPPADDGADTITRNAAFALASQIATASFTAVLTIVLVRVLGPEDYGVFALALSVASLVFLPADFGISQSTARFVAEHRGERDRDRGGDGRRAEAEVRLIRARSA